MARDVVKAKTRKRGHGASERMKRGRKRKRRKYPPPLHVHRERRDQGEGGPSVREEKVERRWCIGEFLRDDLPHNGNNFHHAREERSNKKERDRERG